MKGHFIAFKLDVFQLIVMIVFGFNWLLMVSNTYHSFYTRSYALIKWFLEN